MNQVLKVAVLSGAALSLGGVNAALAQASSDEVRAIVAEAMADAESRSSLLQAGATSGHDGRFFIASPDGAFRLNVGGQIQFRYVANWTDDDDTTAPIDDFEPGFQTRRTKLDFSGNIINRNWQYRVLMSFNRPDEPTGENDSNLEEAWVRYIFGDGLALRWGQFKLPLLREELVSSARQLAAERSLANEAFTQDRSQGIELAYQTEDWRLIGAFSDGLDSENTDFIDNSLASAPGGTSFFVAGEADWAVTARFEYKFGGDWSWFEDFTSPQNQEFAAMVGVAGHYQQGPNSNVPTDIDRDTAVYTADLSIEGGGWNAYGAFIGRYDDVETLGSDNDGLNDFGAVVQGGWRFAPDTELFARWDAIFADEDRATFTDEDNFHFITFGLNQYYAGHAAKATADVVIGLNETIALVNTGLLPNSGTGVLGSSEDTEVTFRLQFQLLF